MNRLLIALIISGIISVILFNVNNEVINPLNIIVFGVLSVLAFKVSSCYSSKMQFSLSYFFLGMAFASFCIGEIVYYLQGFYGIQTFPSFEDIGYAAFYIFGILFVRNQLTYFKIQTTLIKKIIPIITGAALFSIYLTFTWNYENLLEFAIASISMGLSCVFFSLTIFAVFSLQKSKRFKEWILVCVSIGLYSLADLHYYITEVQTEFTYADPSNYGWYFSGMIFIYILIKIRKNPNNPI